MTRHEQIQQMLALDPDQLVASVLAIVEAVDSMDAALEPLRDADGEVVHLEEFDETRTDWWEDIALAAESLRDALSGA